MTKWKKQQNIHAEMMGFQAYRSNQAVRLVSNRKTVTFELQDGETKCVKNYEKDTLVIKNVAGRLLTHIEFIRPISIDGIDDSTSSFQWMVNKKREEPEECQDLSADDD